MLTGHIGLAFLTQERSTGALCSAHLSPHAAAASAAHVAASLRGGHFSVRRHPPRHATDAATACHGRRNRGHPACNPACNPTYRNQVRPLPRLRATIEDAAGARTLLAVNEVFVGEVDPVRPCALEVALDGGPVQECRASGLLVGTQAGASARLTY
jgi:hypothetical protein